MPYTFNTNLHVLIKIIFIQEPPYWLRSVYDALMERTRKSRRNNKNLQEHSNFFFLKKGKFIKKYICSAVKGTDLDLDLINSLTLKNGNRFYQNRHFSINCCFKICLKDGSKEKATQRNKKNLIVINK